MRTPYRYISADSHLEVPPDRWRDRVPAPHRERAPRLIRLSDGTDAWLVENRPLYQGGNNSSAGRPYDTWDPTRMKYEGQAGTGTAEQRLREQDMDGIDAEVLFSTVGGRSSLNGIGDNEAYLAVIRAYNDFLFEEYDNPVGVQLRHYMGVDHVMWLTDFPHGPSDWPNSLDVIGRNFAGVPDDETQLMIAGNAIRFFHPDTTFETSEERERHVADRRSQGSPVPVG